MLKVRVIPTLLWKNFNLVKGVGFDSWRSIGSILPAIKVYNQREVDELILLNISAHLSSDDLDYISINEFGKHCFVPLTVGGGINSINQTQNYLGLVLIKFQLIARLIKILILFQKLQNYMVVNALWLA